MYYSVPASGLNKLAPEPAGFTDSYEENQFRIDGTVGFSVRKFEISARNMYVRRFRPAPADDINRYRGRIAIAHPLAVQWPHLEAVRRIRSLLRRQAVLAGTEDRVVGRRHAAAHEAACRFSRPTCGKTSDGLRDVNYLLFGLIVSTK